MTGLERRVQIPATAHDTLRRYLTPFYCLTLGVLLILVITGCNRDRTPIPTLTSATPPAIAAKTTHPIQFGTQAQLKSSPTSLPAIPATPDERTPSPLGVTAAQLKGRQVNLWYPWKGVPGEIFQTILDEFNRTNKYGITVTSRAFEGFGSLDDAVESAISTRTAPDVLVDYGYRARSWEASGLLADLSPYVDDPVWGLSADEQADFISNFWLDDIATGSNTTTSRRLGIPYYRSAYMLFYNQTWAAELGYPDPPATPEDFRVRACAAAEAVAKSGDKTNLGKGGWLVTPEADVLSGWINAFGSDLVNADGTGYVFNTPQTIQALTYLKALQKSGCAWADSGADPQVEFANRRALFIVGSLFDIPSQSAAFSQVPSNDEWMVIPFPSDRQQVVESYGPSLLVTSSSAAQQLAAWLVVEWLVYPPNQAEFVEQLGVYPTRQSTLSYFAHTDQAGNQYAQALELLPESREEPTLPSWDIIRWVVSDVSSELFSVQFGADQIPSLVEKMDRTVQEILIQGQ